MYGYINGKFFINKKIFAFMLRYVLFVTASNRHGTRYSSADEKCAYICLEFLLELHLYRNRVPTICACQDGSCKLHTIELHRSTVSCTKHLKQFVSML